MKQISAVTSRLVAEPGTNLLSAQTDADKFYKSDRVKMKKVFFSTSIK